MLRLIRRLARRIPFLKAARTTIGRIYIRRALRAIGKDVNRLEPYGYRKYSQNDEDGIIERIFQLIGTTTRTFVEFGAGHGSENNTRKLLIEGWRGLWIDGDGPNVSAIRTRMAAELADRRLVVLQAFVTRENINDLILSADISGEIDFLSIDIDGNDAHVWRAISAVLPRVVCIEYNAFHRPPIEWTIEYDPNFKWDYRPGNSGASLALLERIGREKGYALVGCNITGVNAFFVRSDLVANHFSAPLTAEHHYHPPGYWLISSISERSVRRTDC